MLALAAENSGLSDPDFRFIASLVYQHSGIVIRDNKAVMARGRLARRVKQLGLTSIAAYVERLRQSIDAAELSALLNALTTNHTAFFREAHHFEGLGETLRARIANGQARLRLWSAACSSGEEAYCMAAIVRDALAQTDRRQPVDARILATDIDTEVLSRAQAAVYPAETIEKLGDVHKKLLGAGEAAAAGLRMNKALRDLIVFKPLNLQGDWPFAGPFDTIFCRNVMIYFDAAAKARLIDRFADVLAPGGILAIGHSESLGGQHPRFALIGRTTYRKAA